ncbi:MAG: alpha-amylase family protein [Candidatus Krumholzibacteriia bacterium]
MRRLLICLLMPMALAAGAVAAPAPADSLVTGHFLLNSPDASARISVEAGILTEVRLEVPPQRLANLPARVSRGPLPNPHSVSAGWRTSGGFSFDVVWTGWQAPGKIDNADNQCRFTESDFRCVRAEEREAGGGRDVVLTLRGPEGLTVLLTHALRPGETWLRRSLTVSDPQARGHFLHAIHALDAVVGVDPRIIKPGGFGQPVALGFEKYRPGGAFFGLEWPAADNSAAAVEGGVRVRCGQEIGEVITPEGVTGESVVMAATPDTRVRYWFDRYLDSVRVAPLRPYTLYNSWYDLRSAEYPRVTPDHVMNEANVLRIARLLQENMVGKRGITLDAFVLDDGWDVYESDWVLRPAQFPRGLAPIVAELAKTRTRLGLWLGPTGGYSFHRKRVAWMKQHGYETVGGDLWVGGPKYSDLLIRRTTDFARAGVRYFKWDGFQFLGTGPDLGTPPGIYARRAALKRVQAMVDSVRAVDPDLFLNITSGTWLSPWWLRLADQIWMGGEDYGASDVPSLTTRDASITYRDLVLYEDFRRNDLWFPLASLMTHGILKGTIDVQEIGRGESLAKFADEVVFYLARGVTMHELYISPDLLSEGEWRVLADALRWARDRFPVLKRTEMIGGDPNRLEPYGYIHWDGDDGLLAVRNPDVAPHALTFTLDPADGLEPTASSLVLERIYPTRWVSPDTCRAGDTVELPPLLGYQAAVYELRPLAAIGEPLLADVVFEETARQGAERSLSILATGPRARVLAAAPLAALERDGRPLDPAALPDLRRGCGACFVDGQLAVRDGGRTLAVHVNLAASACDMRACVLLRPAAPGDGKGDGQVAVTLDGRPIAAPRVDVPGKWAWLTVPVPPGPHALTVTPAPGADGREWTGSAAVWVVGDEAVEPVTVVVKGRDPAPPARPLPWAGRGPGRLPRCVRIGETRLGPEAAR